jgi:hypothetical protein
MWLTYSLRRDEFLSHYHKRSNSEAAFSAIKRKFGAAVRSKTFTAQVNEVLLNHSQHARAWSIHGSVGQARHDARREAEGSTG